jgi:oligopeptidase B
MAHTEALQERLFREIRDRVQETDISVPYRRGGYWYYTRFEEGREHPIHARMRDAPDAPEEILLDANERAEGRAFYQASIAVSSGENILAIAEDVVGRNIVTIRFKDLDTGKLLDDVIPAADWSMAWAEDNRTLFYALQDPETLRPHRIYRHVLGTDPAADELVYEEADETFFSQVFKTRSRRYVVIGSHQTLASEYRFVPADRPAEAFTVFLPRERGHEHAIDHLGEHFYVRTNDGSATASPRSKNFRLVRTAVERTDRAHWEEVVPHREDTLLEDFVVFRDHLVLSERTDALLRIRVRRADGTGDHVLAFDEDAYVAAPAMNPETGTHLLRFSYESLTTPLSIFDYDMDRREMSLRKREEVLGGYDPAAYRSGRLQATAGDGTRVPITFVYRRDLRRDGPRPLLLEAYGAYGVSFDPWFASTRLNLLDRGFIYAIAHVRGGQEFGRDWYEAGKLLHKENTFSDFIAAAEHLIGEGFTAADRLYIQGGSAGGMLIGAVVNLRPDLFHGAIAEVPFVDVVTTMLDESIPLTTFEWDEWGDPRDPAFYDYMLGYSPYDNVGPRSYPHLLVTSGLHDSAVQFWEPTKWVAKLRRESTGTRRILLKTNMHAGHAGAAGRYERWREIAFQQAFLLDLADLVDVRPAPWPDIDDHCPCS